MYQSDGQKLVVFADQPPQCDRCPYRHECNGPATVESVLPSDDAFVGCFDTKRQVELYVNLRHRLPTVPQATYPAQPVLPEFVPVLARGIPAGFKPMGLWGVPLSVILSEAGKIKYRSASHLRRALKVPLTTRLCLINTGKDGNLEPFWKRCEELGSWDAIKQLGFEFVTSMTFSVYDERPRFDQIYNQDRNYASYEFFTRRGIPTIPFLFCYADEDYDRAAQWLARHPEVETIAALVQMCDTSKEFNDFRARLKRLHDAAGRPLKTLVVGAAAANRIDKLQQFDNVSFATSKPFQAAIHGEVANESLQHIKDERDKATLLTESLRRYREFLAAPPYARLLTAPGSATNQSDSKPLPLFDTP